MIKRSSLSVNTLGLLACMLIVGLSVKLRAHSGLMGWAADPNRAQPAQATEPSVTLEPGGLRMRGRLLDPTTGSMVAGATVQISGCDGFLAQTTTDDNGAYWIDVPATSVAASIGFTIRVEKSGYWPDEDSWDVAPLVQQKPLLIVALRPTTSRPKAQSTPHIHVPFQVSVLGERADGTLVPVSGAVYVRRGCQCDDLPWIPIGSDGQALVTWQVPLSGDYGCRAMREEVRADGFQTWIRVSQDVNVRHGRSIDTVLQPIVTPGGPTHEPTPTDRPFPLLKRRTVHLPWLGDEMIFP